MIINSTWEKKVRKGGKEKRKKEEKREDKKKAGNIHILSL
jgi:hypothetical protein